MNWNLDKWPKTFRFLLGEEGDDGLFLFFGERVFYWDYGPVVTLKNGETLKIDLGWIETLD